MPLPFPSVYPDPLDPEAAQALASGVAGKPVGAPIPDQAQAMDIGGEEPEQAPAQVQDFGGVDQQNGAPDLVEQGVGDAANRGLIFQGMYGGGNGPGQAVMPEGTDYLSVGGPQGAQNVYDAFVSGPAKLAEAIRAGGEAQAQEGEQLSKVYAEQRDHARDYESALKEQYKLREQEMQSRLAELEKYTKSYTDNLADQGAFWHNPQNVISAMAASLMHLATDDRSLGVRMLNGAIQSDLANRRALAEGHLGQLRSNMAEYDKIAGDKIGGMQLAEAEAKRVAANEIQRIAAQFQGPKAKANAEFIANQLLRESMLGYMDFYRTRLYNKPGLVDPRILKEYQKGGQAFPNAGYTPFSQYPEAQQGAPQPTANAAKAGGYAGAMGSGGGAASVGAALSGGSKPDIGPQIPAQTRAAMNLRFPGGDKLAEAAIQDTRRQAYMEAGVQPGTPSNMMTAAQKHAFNKSMKEQEIAANAQLKEVASGLSQVANRHAGLRLIADDMATVEQAAKQYGIPMDQLVSTKGRASIGGAEWIKLNQKYDALIAADPQNRSKHAEAKAKINAAGERLMQLMVGDINSYYKEHAGSAITSTELPRLEAYVGVSSPYSVLRTYVNNESGKAYGVLKQTVSQLNPAARAIWLMNTGGKTAKLPGTSISPGREAEPKQAAAPMGKNRGPKPKEQ